MLFRSKREIISVVVRTCLELVSVASLVLKRIVISMSQLRWAIKSLSLESLKVLRIKSLKSTDGQGLEVMIP